MGGGTVSIILRRALTGLWRSPVARCRILATAVKLSLLHAIIVPILASLMLLFYFKADQLLLLLVTFLEILLREV